MEKQPKKMFPDRKRKKEDRKMALKASNRRRVAYAIALTAGFMLLFFVLVFTYLFPESTPEFLSWVVHYHLEYMLAMVGLGVVCGALVFYLMHEEVEVTQAESKLNAELALSLLSSDERKTVKLLMEEGGKCLQADVARLEGMTRLKAHRTAKTLSGRGVLKLEKRGKTVVLILADNVKQALQA